MQGELSIELGEGTDPSSKAFRDAIVESLAQSLSIDPAQLIIQDIETRRRRASVSATVYFIIDASPEKVQQLSEKLRDPALGSSMAAGLSSRSISATVSAAVVEESNGAATGTWTSVNGIFYLESCPRGYLLINTTLETQECRQCPFGTYSANSLQGCEPGSCDPRPCLDCPQVWVCECV